MFSPFTLIEPEAARETPLVVASPHSGRLYPGDFNSVAPLLRLRRAEDAFVDLLIGDVSAKGATALFANFPRCYIDVNRSLRHVNPEMIDGDWPYGVDLAYEPARRGLGLFWETIGGTTDIYDRKLSVAEAAERVQKYYRPYRSALERVIDSKVKKFGIAILIDFHSMSSDGSIAVEPKAVRRPDFVVGDLRGQSADSVYVEAVREHLAGCGYSVDLNGYFSGGDILRTFGAPRKRRHAIQIEINRSLYMDEVNLLPSDRFQSIADVIASLVDIAAAEFAVP